METPVAYSGLLRANTVLCSFNTIQPSSYWCHNDSVGDNENIDYCNGAAVSYNKQVEMFLHIYDQ